MSEREEFAARRTDRQDQAIETLLPSVMRALLHYGDDGWYDPILDGARSLFYTVLAEDSGDDSLRVPAVWADIRKSITDTLSRTTTPDHWTGRTIATWLSTYLINTAAATAADNAGNLVLEWVTMHDAKVRPEHHAADGQQRAPGKKFDVGGVPMSYPGDPSAPIEFWINCRCVLRPTSSAAMVAAATDGWGIIIVAIPTDVPAHAEQDPHLTLAWLGKNGENPDLNVDEIDVEVAAHAQQMNPFTADVSAIDSLGDEGALVWMLEQSPATHVRSALLATPAIAKAVGAVEQHAGYTPHVTIGYDIEPTDTHRSVGSITFDKIAVWDGENRYEYMLGQEDDMTASTTEAVSVMTETTGVPWYGVLAPEGEWSGDRRRFAEGALSHRPLPLPMKWQKYDQAAHDDSVVVAKIERMARVGSEVRASGHFLTTPEADEALGLIADFGRFGVSIDADKPEATFSEDDDGNLWTEFTASRVSAATLVPIPAFDSAWLMLGDMPDGYMPDDCDPADPECQSTMPDTGYALRQIAFVSEKPWDGSAARFTPEQWKASCVLHVCDGMEKSCHKLPIKEPGGQLSRAGVHAAAARISQVDADSSQIASAKRALRSAYNQLDETPPDSLTADAQTFARGPGWVTNPEDTKRIHDYWTVPGNEGYAKIGWGTPGDFNRCRAEILSEIAENDPETAARFGNQICAQWHHDATGFWPGQAPAERAAYTEAVTAAGYSLEPAPAVTLLADAGWCAPSEWFADPQFAPDDGRLKKNDDGYACPMTVTEDGQVYGHAAQWGVCHLGTQYEGVCQTAPHSMTNYAYFLQGEILTDAGLVPCGQITIDTGHAPGRGRNAAAHYDNTGTVAAYVTCGEDEYGIWVAGCLSPNASDGQVVALRGAKLSGDWRTRGGNLEMIAVLAVNVPGFPIPRLVASMEGDQQVSLVAAGIPTFDDETEVDAAEVFAERVAAAIEARADRRERMAALAARVNGVQ